MAELTLRGVPWRVSMSGQEIAVVTKSGLPVIYSFETVTHAESSTLEFTGALLKAFRPSREPVTAASDEHAVAFFNNTFYIYRLDNGKWTEVLSSEVKGEISYVENNVAISGDTAILGVPTEDPVGSRVYIWQRTEDNSWSQSATTLQPPVRSIMYGCSLAVDQGTLAVC